MTNEDNKPVHTTEVSTNETLYKIAFHNDLHFEDVTEIARRNDSDERNSPRARKNFFRTQS